MVDYRRYLDYPGGRIVYDMMANRSPGWRDRHLRAEILPPGWKMGISRLGRTPFYDPLIVQEPVERLPILPRRTISPRYQATDSCYDDLDQLNPRLYPEHADLVQRQGPGSAGGFSGRFDDRLRDEIYLDSDDDYPPPRTGRVRRPLPERLHEDIAAGPRLTSHDLDIPSSPPPPHTGVVDAFDGADDLEDDLDWRNPFERRRMPYRFIEEELDFPYDEILYSDDEIDLHRRYAAHERLLMASRERGARERWWELDDD
ncbi:hypothetical protein VE04_04970 [Pseudogymnoascus sp. 24MN13]|nr:hypothetical protein VE04_04970 [Pseudogymnoascus sp. 24MN13]